MRIALKTMLVAVLLVAGALAPSPVAAQGDDVNSLNRRVIELHRAGKFTEAVPLAERYAEAMKARHGPDDPKYATASTTWRCCCRPPTGWPRPSRFMRRALAIDEKSFGPDHPNVAIDLNNLAQLLQATNRLAEAEPLMRRALAI